MCRVIAVSNQKGGVGKTVSCVNLGIGLAQEGRKDDLRKEYSTADVTNRHYQVFFVKHFSLKKASKFPVFSTGISLLLAGTFMHPCA